jgi:hypothetical protein
MTWSGSIRYGCASPALSETPTKILAEAADWGWIALLAANACRHRLATPPLASTIQIGTTERPRVLFPTRDLAKGVAMALSEKALQIVALQR